MNLYETLGVDKTATKPEIKSAYRKKSKETHPDNPNGDKAKFQEVALAHRILSDDEKRKRYDDTGDTSIQQFEVKFMSYVAQAIESMLIQGLNFDYNNIIVLIKKNTEAQIQQGEKNIENNNLELKKVESILKRLKNKGNPTNPIETVLVNRKNGIIANTGIIKEQIQFFKDCYDILGKYDYEVDTAQQQSSFFRPTDYSFLGSM